MLKSINHYFFAIICALGFCTLFVSLPATADVLQWHTSNIQVLRGLDYELGEEQLTIVTLEHANGWRYGDNFGFLDWTRSSNTGPSTYYGEISPRFSLSKLSGKDLSNGLIKDVLISTTIEKPKNKQARYLYGAAIDLNIPAFKFFKFNAYVRDNPALSGRTWQITLAWNVPFKIGQTSILAEGFADFSGAEGGSKANQLIVPRLLVDIGKTIGIADNKLYMGVEWQYWHNKFGISGVTESVPQAQIKWVF